MTLKFTPDGKVDRLHFDETVRRPLTEREGRAAMNVKELADALDECVAAMQSARRCETMDAAYLRLTYALRKIGFEPNLFF